MFRSVHRRSALVIAVVLGMLLSMPVSAGAKKGGDDANTVVSVEFLDEDIVDSGTEFGGTVIGGLSSIAYD